MTIAIFGWVQLIYPNIIFCWCVVDVRWFERVQESWSCGCYSSDFNSDVNFFFVWDPNTNQLLSPKSDYFDYSMSIYFYSYVITRRYLKHFVRERRRERIQPREGHLNQYMVEIKTCMIYGYAEFKIWASYLYLFYALKHFIHYYWCMTIFTWK